MQLFDQIADHISERHDQIAGHIAERQEQLAEYMPELSFNHPDINRDAFMLHGELAKEGYDWWWHSFTGRDKETGEEKAFFIEFFTINPELGEEEPVFGQLPENKKAGKRPSYLMVKAGAWGEDAVQLHRFFGWKSGISVSELVPFQISADECFLSETRTMGRVELSQEEVDAHPEYMCDAGQMIWDLKIDKKIAFNVGYGAGKALRDLDAFEMFWHAQGMKTIYEGKVFYNGREYEVTPETCYGYADKNWGKDFTSPWVWLSSNNLTSKISGKKLLDSAFDIGGGRPKVGHIALERKLLSAFWYEGQAIEFNFSKFWTLTRTEFKGTETDDQIIWDVMQETPLHKMEVHITCEKKDMLLVNYESPDGAKRHNRLWNGGNGVGVIKLYEKTLSVSDMFEWKLMDEIEAKNIGCEYGEYN